METIHEDGFRPRVQNPVPCQSVRSGSLKQKGTLLVHITTFVERTTQMLSLLGGSARVCRSYELQTYKYFSRCDSHEVYVRDAKVLCTFFRARYLRGSWGGKLPDMRGFAYGGPFRRWYRRRLTFSERNTHLWTSFWNFKNSALPVDPSVVSAAYRAHARDIEQPDVALRSDVVHCVNMIQPVLYRLAELLARDAKRLTIDMFDDMMSSQKASASYRQSDGGQVIELCHAVFNSWPCVHEEIRDTTCGMKTCGRTVYTRCPHGSPGYAAPYPFWSVLGRRFRGELRGPMFPPEDLWRMGITDRESGNALPGKGRLKRELRRHEVEPHSWDAGVFESRMHYLENEEEPSETDDIIEINDGELTHRTETTQPGCLKQWRENITKLIDVWDREDRNLVDRCVMVCEPLKTRPITVADALHTYVMTWFQKRLHGHMRRIQCFRLLGEAPQATHIMGLWERRLMHTPGVWLSSDFKGASNNTPEEFRRQIQRDLTWALPRVLQRFVERDNHGAWILYPPSLGIPPARQVRGTLMGHKSSFPILSLQVLATYAWALRRSGSVATLTEVMDSCYINGDDFLAYVELGFPETFWETCGLMQFSESVGKSYEHPLYANINSQSYHVIDGHATKVGGLYCGLLCGQKKLSTDIFGPLEVWNEILGSCFGGKMEQRVATWYLKRYARRIHMERCGRDLFIPIALGGCGLRQPVAYRRGRHDEVWPAPVLGKRCMLLAERIYEADPYLHFTNDFPDKSEVPPVSAPWDVEGIPVFWDQIRRLQDTNGIDLPIPLDVIEKYLRLPVCGVNPTRRYRGVKVRRLSMSRHQPASSPEVPFYVRWADPSMDFTWCPSAEITREPLNFEWPGLLPERVTTFGPPGPKMEALGLSRWQYTPDLSCGDGRAEWGLYCEILKEFSALPAHKTYTPPRSTRYRGLNRNHALVSVCTTLSGTHGSWCRDDDHDRSHGHPLFWWQHDRVKLVNWDYYHSLPADPPLRRFLYLQSVGYHPGYAWHIRCDICGEILHCGHADCEASLPRLHYHPYRRVSRLPQEQPGIDLIRGVD